MNIELLVGSGNGEAASDHALEVSIPSSHFCSWVGWDIGCPECIMIPLTSIHLEFSFSCAHLCATLTGRLIVKI